MFDWLKTRPESNIFYVTCTADEESIPCGLFVHAGNDNVEALGYKQSSGELTWGRNDDTLLKHFHLAAPTAKERRLLPLVKRNYKYPSSSDVVRTQSGGFISTDKMEAFDGAVAYEAADYANPPKNWGKF